MGQFEPLEEVLDGAVGASVELEVERGGKVVSAKPPSGPHAITPMSYDDFTNGEV